MKNKVVVLVIILIFSCTLFGVNYYQKVKNNEKEEKTFENEQANIKDDEAYGEEMISSLSIMYKNMVNNKEANLSYLGDIINTKSEAYLVIENKIKEYREKKITIEYFDYYIDKMEKIAPDEFKVYITLDESIYRNEKSEKDKKKVEIKLKLVDDRGIYEYKEI
ncbi:hypothetical protein [Clostridium intestinale]|uniref:Lipoprotein n=1 Tax=Clostridium intestinale DSM 6191 TaxID=1121320 RepID=A0A1M6DQ28_9CLOT|nr:hypothetical protein [Clostridium intestinale]SHI75337.1 hypothetical protein SAMN02745941_04289 [Clostridium intestinale DSM 6191]